MILASAQTNPKRGDIEGNLQDHYRLIEMAGERGADLIVFPEMSITGYEREMGDMLAFTPDDSRLGKLAKLAVDSKIVIIAGAPIRIAAELFIGSFIFQPDDSISIYTKQFLHLGEEDFYAPSFDFNPVISLENERISFAICADIDHPKHPENAGKADCSIYTASLFFSPNGIPSAHRLLSSYAKKYSMNVLMSNFSGESWGQASGGRSGFWDKNGVLIAEMDDYQSGILVVEKKNGIWTGQTII